MPTLQKNKLFIIGYLSMLNCVSCLIKKKKINEYIYLDHKSIIYVSDGLGWTEEQKNILIRENEIQLDLCQIQLDFTFSQHLTEEV
jgi:hypothetical protein